MRKWTAVLFGAMLGLCALSAGAENIEFFRASRQGADAWIPKGARIKEKLGKLLVSERSKQGASGYIMLGENLPYFSNARITLDVHQVQSGSYTLQVMAFRDGAHVTTIDLAKGTRKKGRTVFSMEDYDVPEGVDDILLKLWVGGGRGASVKVNDVVYDLEIDDNSLVMNELFTNTSGWEGDKAVLEQTSNGSVIQLSPKANFGSLLLKRRLERRDFDVLYLEAPMIEAGRMTVQFVAFDHRNGYLASVDVLKNAQAGSHIIRSADVLWPHGTERFMIKLWLSGRPAASASLARMLVIHPDAVPGGPPAPSILAEAD